MLKMFTAIALLSTSFFISNAWASTVDAQAMVTAHNR